MREEAFYILFYRDGFSEISRFVNVKTFKGGDVVSEKLERRCRDERSEKLGYVGQYQRPVARYFILFGEVLCAKRPKCVGSFN